MAIESRTITAHREACLPAVQQGQESWTEAILVTSQGVACQGKAQLLVTLKQVSRFFNKYTKNLDKWNSNNLRLISGLDSK